jgi:hypothetical protein
MRKAGTGFPEKIVRKYRDENASAQKLPYRVPQVAVLQLGSVQHTG